MQNIQTILAIFAPEMAQNPQNGLKIQNIQQF
jgi:hypothetical protein